MRSCRHLLDHLGGRDGKIVLRHEIDEGLVLFDRPKGELSVRDQFADEFLVKVALAALGSAKHLRDRSRDARRDQIVESA